MNKKQSSSSKCADCGKKTNKVATQEWVIDYRWNNPDWKPGDTTKEYLCLNCGDKVYQQRIADENERARRNREQIETDAKNTANNCFTELKKLNEEFDEKIENEDLGINDYKKFCSLKNKVNKLIRIGGIEKWDNYWMAKTDFELLKRSINSLEEKVKENTSPQTIDKARGKKGRKVRECSHKNVEFCTDDSTFFCCNYCWDTESLEFLKRLKNYHMENIDKLLRDNGFSTFEIINNSNYSKLLNHTFSNQEELKTVYQSIEQDLQKFLKQKGINLDKKSRIKNQESRIKNQESRIKNQESRIKNQESRIRFSN